MKPAGLHLLLTYECNLECDHCFVWGSPYQTGTMTLRNLRRILNQAVKLGNVEWIYFEGGEPFLYYPILLAGVRMARSRGFHVGIVSNAHWAMSERDAVEWLRPFAGLVEDLSISSDQYHNQDEDIHHVRYATVAAQKLRIPQATLSVAQPEETTTTSALGQLPPGKSAVMYRGRAAEKLAERAPQRRWFEFTRCPYENLRDPGRVHIDPLGEIHLCQGISMGNVFKHPLIQIFQTFNPEADPIVGPLLYGGPARLVEAYGLPHEESYADACHLCYETRLKLRERFPGILKPDQMYGVSE